MTDNTNTGLSGFPGDLYRLFYSPGREESFVMKTYGQPEEKQGGQFFKELNKKIKQQVIDHSPTPPPKKPASKKHNDYFFCIKRP